jgi:hypothetical protein
LLLLLLSLLLFTTTTGPSYVYARDIDGDSAKDIVFASATGNRLGWFEELCATSLPGGGDGTPRTTLSPSPRARTQQTHALTCHACATTCPRMSDDHVVGWAVAGGVIGGLLILWILVAIAIAIHDYIRHQMRKASEQRKKEAKVVHPFLFSDLLHASAVVAPFCSQHTRATRYDTTRNEQAMLPTEHDDL